MFFFYLCNVFKYRYSNFMTREYPNKISPCPIVETTINIKYSSKIPKEVLLGVVYNPLQQIYGDQKLIARSTPLASIPDAIREQDPNLRDRPTAEILCPEGRLQLGQNNIFIGLNMPYSSWDNAHKFVDKILNTIIQLNIISNVDHVSLKYLDFFSGINIFNQINLNITWPQKNDICSRSTAFKTELTNNGFIHVLQITNSVHLKNEFLEIDNDGSLIDMTTVGFNIDTNNMINKIDECHTESKNFFFDLLKKEFIETLSPEY